MRKFLRRLYDLVVSSMEDFSRDHSPVSVSSCGVVCFDIGEGRREIGAETNLAGSLQDGAHVVLGDLSAPVPQI